MPISRRKVVGGTLGLLTTSATSAQKKETPPRRLSEILPKLAWDGAKRGPLLIVDAFMTFSVAPYYWEKFTQRAVPSPQNGMLYTLGEIEVIFGRQPLFYNGLTVLAPTTMVQLSTRLQDADITDSNLAPKTAHRLLVAQMTSAQRHQLSSTGGFGLSNCSDEAQKRLFLLAIPNPFLDAKGKLLSEAERRQIHLQAFRSAKIMPLIEGGTLFDSSLVASHVATRSTNADYQRESAFGQSIRQIVPATNKRSGLSYDRPELDRLIPLGEVKTVQELVERVAKASGLELYADARMGRLKVSLLATPQARTSAGVLLKALARAVTGTFRQVGGAYVLTDDLIGYGTRAGWIGEWLMEADAAQWDMMTKAESALAQSQSWQDFGYDPRLGFSLSPQQEKLWREQMLLPWEERRKKHGIFGIHFTAKELTAAQLSSLAPQIKQIEEEVSTPSKPRTIERDR
ncbi:hypothetical protein, partial [Armatimonas sp.]|uniref:hypothetical protein n=1 Tax=Armatimonas sp. TaxID=1872638 RepID=UPI003751B870